LITRGGQKDPFGNVSRAKGGGSQWIWGKKKKTTASLAKKHLTRELVRGGITFQVVGGKGCWCIKKSGNTSELQ